MKFNLFLFIISLCSSISLLSNNKTYYYNSHHDFNMNFYYIKNNDEDILYDKKEQKPFTGSIYITENQNYYEYLYHEIGEISLTIQKKLYFTDGKKDGSWVEEIKKNVFPFENDEIKKYYIQKIERNFLNNFLHGIQKNTYYDSDYNEIFYNESNYLHGKYIGNYLIKLNNTILYETTLTNGNGYIQNYDFYIDLNFENDAHKKTYIPKAKLISEGTINNGFKQGPWKIYLDEEFIETGMFRDGKKDGLWQIYNSLGTLIEETEYTNNNKNDFRKDYYQGKLSTKYIFNNNILSHIYFYDENENIIETKDYN